MSMSFGSSDRSTLLSLFAISSSRILARMLTDLLVQSVDVNGKYLALLQPPRVIVLDEELVLDLAGRSLPVADVEISPLRI